MTFETTDEFVKHIAETETQEHINEVIADLCSLMKDKNNNNE